MAQTSARSRAAPSFMLAAPLAIVGLASFLGSWWGPLDLLSHFRPQWAAASLVAVLVALHAASRAGAVLSLCLLAAHTLPLTPYLAGIGSARSVAQTEVRVMTLNLRNRHTSADSFRALIEAEDPDIVLLTELPQDETPLLQAVGDRYPQRTASRRGSPFDVVLLSRWTVETWSADRSVTTFLPVLTARLCDPSSSTHCLTVVGLHAARPFGSGADRQKAQLSLVVDAVKAVPTGRVVVLGDLNLTPWSATFHRFVREAGLSDNPRERGLVATWLSRFPLFGLALDHVLAGHGVEIVQSRVGRDVGSDHFAVTAHLALRPDP